MVLARAADPAQDALLVLRAAAAAARADLASVLSRGSAAVLHRITAALTSAGLDVRTAHISTLGADVVDAFYVVGRDGRKVADAEPGRRAVLAALTAPGP